MVCPDNPSENGAALLPVSRDWNFAPSPANDDWTYAVFDWDNIFASLLAGIGNKTIAYSNLIQVSQRYFVHFFCTTMIVLPRQARDKPRESTPKTRLRFSQVIKSKTAAGFVPNFAAGGSKSMDRTEPPIGSKTLLELYKKYGDKWMVSLLFDDLCAHLSLCPSLALYLCLPVYIYGYMPLAPAPAPARRVSLQAQEVPRMRSPFALSLRCCSD